jgi:outer membrane lipoprotein SlyB
METESGRSFHPLMWIASIAVTVFSALGIAALMGWLPTSIGSSNDSAVAPKVVVAPAHPDTRKSHTAPPRLASNSPIKSTCIDCGVIESTREIDKHGAGSGLGVVGGAVVGGVLGHQVGGGRGQDVATVAGAVGGAFAGNEIEKRIKSTKSYDITVRFDDGSSRVINEANTPTWVPGDKVKVIDGVIRSNG